MVLCYFIITAFVLVHIDALNQKEYPFLKSQINDEKHAVAFNKLLNSIVKVNQKRLDSIKKLTKLQATDLNPTLDDSLRSETMRSTHRSDTTRRDSDESDSDSEEKNIIYLVIPDSPAPSTQDPRPVNPLSIQNNTNPNLAGSQRSRPHNLQIEPNVPIPDPQRLFPNEIQDVHDLSKIRGPNDTFRQVSISRDGLDALRQSIERSCRSREVKKCRKACRAAVSSACREYDCRKKLKKKLKRTCKRECKEEFSGSW